MLHVVVFQRPLNVMLDHTGERLFGFLRRGAGFDKIELQAVSDPFATFTVTAERRD